MTDVMRPLPLALLALSAAACAAPVEGHTSSRPKAPTSSSSPTDPSSDANPPADAPPAPPAFRPDFPVVENAGGQVIAHPRVVPIVFSGDPLTNDISTFLERFGASDYWAKTASEYGVGAFTASAPIVAQNTVSATITDDQVQQWIASNLSGSIPAFGRPDASTLYAVFLPPGVTVQGNEGCATYFGYHYETVANGIPVAFALMPRCDGSLDSLTVTTAHEIFEWATDPFPSTRPAFAKVDDAHWAWQAAMIGELGDLCSFLDLDMPRPPEVGYAVQRFWSNKLSSAGNFPCAPLKQVAYVQAVPDASDDALVPQFPAFTNDPSTAKLTKTKAIRVQPGATRTVDVHVYADDPSVRSVTVTTVTMDPSTAQPSTSSLFTYAVTSDAVGPGGVAKLTITAPTTVGAEVLLTVVGDPAKDATYWPVLVTNDDEGNVTKGVATVTPSQLAALFARYEAGGGPDQLRRPIRRHKTHRR